MRVILVKDVPHLGQAHTLKEVADGYARNYLIPRGLAVYATRAALKVLEARLAKAAAEQKALLAKAADLIKQLKGAVVTLAGQAEKDTLFGSFGADEIAAALAAQGIRVPANVIKLPKSLKKVGEHAVIIEFSPALKTALTVRVRALGESAAADKKTKAKRAKTVAVKKAKSAAKNSEIPKAKRSAKAKKA